MIIQFHPYRIHFVLSLFHIILFCTLFGFVSYYIDVMYWPIFISDWLRFILLPFHVILLFILFGFVSYYRRYILSIFVYCLASFHTFAVSCHPIVYIVWLYFAHSPFHIILFCILFGFVLYSCCFILSYFVYCLD